jgi:ABC-2 type transport system permease protein
MLRACFGGRRAGRAQDARPRVPGRLAAAGAPRKEWLLLARDPWLASHTLMQMQMLYLVPPAVLLSESFEASGGAANLAMPVLVMAAGQLAGGLAWLTMGRARPRRHRTSAPALRSRRQDRGGARHHRRDFYAARRCPRARRAAAAPIAALGIIIAAASATAIQL